MSSGGPAGDEQPAADEDGRDEPGSDEPVTAGPLIERFDCPSASRPDCDVPAGEEFEWEHDGETRVLTSAGSADYPEPPDEFGSTAVRSFVEAHELAYAQNEYVCRQRRPETVVGFSAGTSSSGVLTFDWYEDVHVVRVDYACSANHYSEEYGLSVADGAPTAAVYAVDETAAVRTTGQGRELLDEPVNEATPDPVTEGDLVVCF